MCGVLGGPVRFSHVRPYRLIARVDPADRRASVREPLYHDALETHSTAINLKALTERTQVINSTSSSSSSRGGGRRAAKPVDLAALFKAADADGDGHLSPADFEAALASLGEPLSRTELAAVMRYFDADRSGRVSYIEFLAGVFDWQRLRAAARRSAEALRAR